MLQSDLDIQLRELLLNDFSEDFISFCHSVVPRFPVAVNLSEQANLCYDMMGNAMVVFSGYRGEEFAGLARMAEIMVRREVESGRWKGLPADEVAVGELIARRCYEELVKAGGDEADPERVYLVMGLYAYVSVVCNEGFDGESFMRLFVLGWFTYYSTVLSVEGGVGVRGAGFVS